MRMVSNSGCRPFSRHDAMFSVLRVRGKAAAKCSFQYDAGGSGELTQVTPHPECRGHLDPAARAVEALDWTPQRSGQRLSCSPLGWVTCRMDVQTRRTPPSGLSSQRGASSEPALRFLGRCPPQ